MVNINSGTMQSWAKEAFQFTYGKLLVSTSFFIDIQDYFNHVKLELIFF